MSGTDAIQTLLMATPVLSTTALAAFSHVMNGPIEPAAKRASVSALYMVFSVSFPLALLALIFSIFYLFWLQVDGFGPDQLKIALGALETFFGVYLGVISKSLFGADVVSPQ